MELQIDSENKTATLVLKGEISIYQVVQLKETRLNAFNQADEVFVDVEAVTEMDTAAIQLLFAGWLEAQKRGKKLLLPPLYSSLTDHQSQIPSPPLLNKMLTNLGLHTHRWVCQCEQCE